MVELINLAMARRIKELEKELEREKFMHQFFFKEWSKTEDDWADAVVELNDLKRKS